MGFCCTTRGRYTYLSRSLALPGEGFCKDTAARSVPAPLSGDATINDVTMAVTAMIDVSFIRMACSAPLSLCRSVPYRRGEAYAQSLARRFMLITFILS